MPADSLRSSPLARAFAWVGGAAFVASLAYTGYFYLVLLGRVYPASDRHSLARASAANTMLFALFALHHSVAARSSVKRWVTRRIPAALERSTYVWVSSLLLALVCYLWRPMPGAAIYRATGAGIWVAVALQLSGIVLIIRVTRLLDVRDLAGIRQVSGPAREQRFLAKGPYRWIRHPLYLGWILAVFGTPHLTPGRLLFAVISSVYLVIAIAWEEHSLRDAIGEPYHAYMREVPWKLVPFLY